MRFDAPVLLYGAGREARSTRAFLKARAPELKVYVTVDSGAGRHRRRRVHRPDRPAGGDRAKALRHHRQVARACRATGRSSSSPARPASPSPPTSISGASIYRDGRTVIAITGTKGKSTTATLVHLMLTAVRPRRRARRQCRPRPARDRRQAQDRGVRALELPDRRHGVLARYRRHHQPHARAHRLAPRHRALLRRQAQPHRPRRAVPGGARRRRATTTRWCSRRCATCARLLPPLAPFIADRIASAVARSRLKGAHNLDNARLAAQTRARRRRRARRHRARHQRLRAAAASARRAQHRRHHARRRFHLDHARGDQGGARRLSRPPHRADRRRPRAPAGLCANSPACSPRAASPCSSPCRSPATASPPPPTPPRPQIEVVEAGTLASRPRSARHAARKIRHRHPVARARRATASSKSPASSFNDFEERGRAFVRIATELFGDDAARSR